MIIILCAPSGSGKSTMVKHLLETYPGQYELSISATTRAPRGQEQHGKEYYFISREEFEQHIANQDFIEYEQVYEGLYYGTLKSEIERIQSAGRTIVFDIDVKGGLNLKRIFGDEALAIFIAPPSVEELSHLSENLATVCICGTLGTYLGNALEETYGVPYVRTLNHSGITGFETWLRAIGDTIGKRDEAEAYIEKQRAIFIPQIEEVTKSLHGLRAVIGMGPGFTYEIARVLQEFGMKVDYALAWHYDYKYDNGQVPPALEHLVKTSPKDMKVAVADQQNYEVLNILNRYKPDVYFSRHPGTTVWAIKQGYAAVFVADEYTVFGYEGTLSFAKLIRDTVTNRSFEKNLAARIQLPYTKWWYEQNYDKFIKEEGVK